jgi:uncharacterized protein (UPF0210 family)
MKIRSITFFCNPGFPLNERILQEAGDFLAQAKTAYESAGYEVQTVRLATIPFPRLLGESQIEELPRLAETLTRLLPQIGIAYASLGPALPGLPRSYDLIPEAIAASENIFFGGIMAGRLGDEPPDSHIDMQAVQACSEIIVRCAPLDSNGFANLRFAALANVPPGAPFFPAAYHAGDEPAFAVATEAADLAVSAFQDARTVEAGRKALIAEVQRHGQALAEIAVTRLWNVPFRGVDFSLAPFPDDAHSLGNAVEQMGVPRIGLHGSLAAAALLTEVIERADFPRTGFGGFMQPVLEDSVLAARAAEGALTVKDALLYSAVCGTGLDTVPLPGDTTAEQLTPLLLDLSALALRLDKPLTARLMPVPGKKAGEPTTFDFGFFANSKVMALESAPLHGPLANARIIPLYPRRR